MQSGITTTRLQRGADGRFVTLRRQLGVTSFGLNQIVLRPGQRGRIHRHLHQEEVYLVLAGTLTIVLESESIDLGADELIRIAPDVRRQLVNRGREPVVIVAIGGAAEHLGRDGEAFAAWEDTTPATPQELSMPPDLPTDELR
jgi:mannose-6-phosphate isomerase-like protein (cupin superfamily)